MNPTILVVEEDRGGRALLVRWLEQGGYQVRGAGNSAEACRRIAARSPDVVVIDAGSGYRAGWSWSPRCSPISRSLRCARSS